MKKSPLVVVCIVRISRADMKLLISVTRANWVDDLWFSAWVSVWLHSCYCYSQSLCFFLRAASDITYCCYSFKHICMLMLLLVITFMEFLMSWDFVLILLLSPTRQSLMKIFLRHKNRITFDLLRDQFIISQNFTFRCCRSLMRFSW